MSGFLSASSFCCNSWLFALCPCSYTVLTTVGHFFWASGSDSCRIWRTVRSLIEGASKTNSFVEISLTFSRLTHTSKSLLSMRWSLVNFDDTSSNFVISMGSIDCPCACSCSCVFFTACCLWVKACLFFKRRGQFMDLLLFLIERSMTMSPLSYCVL